MLCWHTGVQRRSGHPVQPHESPRSRGSGWVSESRETQLAWPRSSWERFFLRSPVSKGTDQLGHVGPRRDVSLCVGFCVSPLLRVHPRRFSAGQSHAPHMRELTAKPPMTQLSLQRNQKPPLQSCVRLCGASMKAEVRPTSPPVVSHLCLCLCRLHLDIPGAAP